MNAADCKVQRYEVITYIDARNLIRNLGVQWSHTYVKHKSMLSSIIVSVVFMDGELNVATYVLDDMILEIYKPGRPMKNLTSILQEI